MKSTKMYKLTNFTFCSRGKMCNAHPLGIFSLVNLKKEFSYCYLS